MNGPAVMLSIHPEYEAKIESREKLIEVRKYYPHVLLPFKCFIYRTKPRWGRDLCEKDGKVTGEFICREFVPIEVNGSGSITNFYYYDLETTCLGDNVVSTHCRLANYVGNNRTAYGLKISDLKIYDKPKLLSDFISWKTLSPLTRPPQSYHYVFEKSELENIVQ